MRISTTRPSASDLYFVEREGPDGEIRVRFLNRDFQNKLERRELAWCESFPVRVSQNASYFFGDSKFDANPVGRILQLLGRNAGRELECFDWYFGRRSDGEKSRLCATIAAYFRSVPGHSGDPFQPGGQRRQDAGGKPPHARR